MRMRFVSVSAFETPERRRSEEDWRAGFVISGALIPALSNALNFMAFIKQMIHSAAVRPRGTLCIGDWVVDGGETAAT